MTENNKNLIPLSKDTLPAIIEQRTQIANRVLGQLSSDQTEAFFRKYPEFLGWCLVAIIRWMRDLLNILYLIWIGGV